MSVQLCDVKGCNEPSEAFCYAANHNLCKDHHSLFHRGQTPLPPNERPTLRWKSKPQQRLPGEIRRRR